MHAGNWIRETAKLVGGSGGGKPGMAQAGGKDPEKLPQALGGRPADIDAKLAGKWKMSVGERGERQRPEVLLRSDR